MIKSEIFQIKKSRMTYGFIYAIWLSSLIHKEHLEQMVEF